MEETSPLADHLASILISLELSSHTEVVYDGRHGGSEEGDKERGIDQRGPIQPSL